MGIEIYCEKDTLLMALNDIDKGSSSGSGPGPGPGPGSKSVVIDITFLCL